MTYSRRQPWRPRSSWLGARSRARRRGYRQDELTPISEGAQLGLEAVAPVAGEAVLDDIVLAERMPEPVAQHLAPARVDISGLQAIAALAPERCSSPPEDRAFPTVDWQAFGERSDDERYLSRHSA